MQQRALFIDRDGTLVHAVHYPSRPEQLRLYDGIGAGLSTLQAMGFLLIMITNQSGIARGYFQEDDLVRMHQGLDAQLQALGVRLDGVYYCPHHPDGAIEKYAIMCNCRKPQPGMLLQAASDLDIDLQRSWFVGDILDDVEAGNRAGCHTVLVDVGTESRPDLYIRTPAFVARNTGHALNIIKTVSLAENTLDLVYLPAAWTLEHTIEVTNAVST